MSKNTPPKDLDDACRAGIIRTADDLRARVQRVPPPPPPQSATTNGHAPPDGMPEFIEMPAAEFPIGLMPAVIRDLANECARAMCVPSSLPAVCMLGVVSGALGSRLRVRSIHGKITPGNVMILVGAESGTGKSEVHRVAIAPLQACQEREAKIWEKEVRPGAAAEVRMLGIELKKMADVLKNGKTADRASLKRGIAAKERDLAIYEAQLKPPYYFASDFTTAELINLLSRMDGQLFASSPDAKNFADMILGRYNEGGTDEEVYLKAFSLEAIDRHRVGDGNRSTPEACVAGLWLTQPDKIQRLLAKRELSEGGLLPRLLLASYFCRPLRVNLNEQGIDAELLAKWGELVTELFDVFRLGEKPMIIEAEQAAHARLAGYHNAIADRRESDLRDVTSFAARWGELAWRLALVIHAARLGENAADEPLTVEDAEAGIGLMEWFASQQLDALHAGREQAREERMSAVMKLFIGQSEVVARDLYRTGITPRDNPDIAVTLLREMEGRGKLVSHERETGRRGHIQTVYTQRK